MKQHEIDQVNAFLEQRDSSGSSNLEKIRERQHIIRRVDTTDHNKSYEDASRRDSGGAWPDGVVVENDRLIGFGIHILNEDVYPLQSFEIYFRNCDLAGKLDLSNCRDMIFVDLYHNRIAAIDVSDMPSLRILGLQDNRITELNPSGCPICQGIDVGKNKLRSIDVSQNGELVELYINDNEISEVDLSNNKKLKYFYCQNNRITELDTTNNPLLRHLDATGNPLRRICSCAPRSHEQLPLALTAGEGGTVGLKFNPIYDAQWKETGEWRQAYYAYPAHGYRFSGWLDENGHLVSIEETWIDTYGASRILIAQFLPND